MNMTGPTDEPTTVSNTSGTAPKNTTTTGTTPAIATLFAGLGPLRFEPLENGWVVAIGPSGLHANALVMTS